MAKTVHFRGKYWLDEKTVALAVREASINPLRKCAMLVQREARASMKGGARSRGTRRTVPPEPPGGKPRVRTGTLRASITYAKVEGRDAYIVGPTREAWYGRVHEFGAVIRVTEKMRAFLHWRDIHLRASTTRIHIPARPFMRPALLRCREMFPAQFRGLNLRDTRAGRSLRGRKR